RFQDTPVSIIKGREGRSGGIGRFGKSGDFTKIRSNRLGTIEAGCHFIIGIKTLYVHCLYLLIVVSFPVFLVLPGQEDIFKIILGFDGKSCQKEYDQNGKPYAHDAKFLTASVKTEKPRVNYCQYLYF